MNSEPSLFLDDTQHTTQPVGIPVPVIPQSKPSMVRIWFIAGSAIVIGISVLFIWKLLNPPPKPIIQVTLSPTPTPTPIRILSSIATESAFMRLMQSQASLSAGLSATNLHDPSLSPPVLELPLGFKP